MLMSVISRPYEFVAMPELSGSRVLITGLTSTSGFDLARGFADHGARLVIQSPEDTPEMTELAAVLAENSSDIRLFNDPLQGDEDAQRLVQTAVKDFGGLDSVVNLVTVDPSAVARLETVADVERLVADVLRLPLRLTEITANRMRLVWIEGSILNVVRVAGSGDGRSMMFADVLRATLADLTRSLAQDWAAHGVRINAVAPPSSIAVMGRHGDASDADLAAVALEMASRKGRSISGHVLDAEGAARRWC
ncbi:SDR family oxidoreductase [Hyphomicrobium sp. LHD-15]|uniref:SDR family oxidoreductase n=1 Tax=Hyphomicrobium sp. LHD-15 TaxID=3072142 RepID=UPI00281022CB|nr:SDR family oxidoreductase [Hyphomicrobium sp. LHD-15]MDQ8700484.1 SDR family oxidoreductase [Hyphomicrobium sp. LHD-15]